jgi:chromosome segregation ATPase
MTEDSSPARSLRERLGEERLGKALSELLESPLFTGALGRAFDAREKAAQAQMLALGALNLPSAADIERLTRRVRSVSQRLEAIEDGVERLDSSHLAAQRGPAELEARLAEIEQQLGSLTGRLDTLLTRLEKAAAKAPAARAPAGKAPAAKAPKRARAGKAKAPARPALIEPASESRPG